MAAGGAGATLRYLRDPVVAFPQRGVLAGPGTAEQLDAAVRAGANVVNGLDRASVDGDVEGQLRIVFEVAERHGVRVDVHLHDPSTLGTFQLRRTAWHARGRRCAPPRVRSPRTACQ